MLVLEPHGNPSSCPAAPGWAEQLWVSFSFAAEFQARPTLGRLRKQPEEQIRAGAHPDVPGFTQALSPGTTSPARRPARHPAAGGGS